MDYEISMKELKEIDSVAAEAYYNIPLCDGVHDRFTLKHYCIMDRGILNRKHLSHGKVMGRENGLRSLKYILCNRPSLSFRRIYVPDKKLTMRFLKRRERNTGLKMKVWSDI